MSDPNSHPHLTEILLGLATILKSKMSGPNSHRQYNKSKNWVSDNSVVDNYITGKPPMGRGYLQAHMVACACSLASRAASCAFAAANNKEKY